MLLAHLVHHFPQGAQKGLIAAGKCRIPGPDLFIRGINVSTVSVFQMG